MVKGWKKVEEVEKGLKIPCLWFVDNIEHSTHFSRIQNFIIGFLFSFCYAELKIIYPRITQMSTNFNFVLIRGIRGYFFYYLEW